MPRDPPVARGISLSSDMNPDHSRQRRFNQPLTRKTSRDPPGQVAPQQKNTQNVSNYRRRGSRQTAVNSMKRTPAREVKTRKAQEEESFSDCGLMWPTKLERTPSTKSKELSGGETSDTTDSEEEQLQTKVIKQRNNGAKREARDKVRYYRSRSPTRREKSRMPREVTRRSQKHEVEHPSRDDKINQIIEITVPPGNLPNSTQPIFNRNAPSNKRLAHQRQGRRSVSRPKDRNSRSESRTRGRIRERPTSRQKDYDRRKSNGEKTRVSAKDTSSRFRNARSLSRDATRSLHSSSLTPFIIYGGDQRGKKSRS